VLIGVFKSYPMYEVTVVYDIREGKIVWSRPQIVVMITFGREKLMQHYVVTVCRKTYRIKVLCEQVAYRK